MAGQAERLKDLLPFPAGLDLKRGGRKTAICEEHGEC
jgi:hypothetical protein